MTDLLTNNAVSYLIVGTLTCGTTIGVTLLNRRFAKKIKPEQTPQAGYTEWVAYLERELQDMRKENKALNDRVDRLADTLREKESIIARMRNKLLEFSRKYNEDVSTII